jgi:hypothetical protein
VNGRTVLTLLLYLWIGVTVAMVLMWLFRRRSDPKTTLGASTTPGAPTDIGTETENEAGMAQTLDPESSPDSANTVVLGGSDPTRPPSNHDKGLDDEVLEDQDDGATPGGDREPVEPDHDDRALVSTALGVGLTSTPSSGGSVADLLVDIELPYDLQPVDLGNTVWRAVYLSPHSNPEDVGTEFADELVKLGYSIEPMGLDQAVARRGRDVLHMRIVPEAGTVVADDGETRPYEQASPTDTALELWIGDEADAAIRW